MPAGSVARIARPPRIEVPDGIYHVVARGNERRAIYRDAADCERFLEILAQTGHRYGWRALAYCLMSNHYHLLVQTPNTNLARGMRELNGVYAQAFNRRHGRVGHLFQGRHRALLVQADEHLLSAVRYILRNPLRAAMCERVSDWPWSSHAATAGTRPAGFLATSTLLGFLHEDRPRARALYLALVEADLDPAPPAHPLLHGDEGFVDVHLARLDPSPEHPRASVRSPRRALPQLVAARSDAAAIARAHREHGYSMREIASHLGCGVTTVPPPDPSLRAGRFDAGRMKLLAHDSAWNVEDLTPVPRLGVERGRPDPGSTGSRGDPGWRRSRGCGTTASPRPCTRSAPSGWRDPARSRSSPCPSRRARSSPPG